MVIPVGNVAVYSWILLLAYFPLGVVGVWRWSVWLIKKAYALQYRPATGKGVGSVSVVTPVYNEDPVVFARAVASWRENGVDEVVAVIDYTDTKCIELFQEYQRTWSGAQLIITKKPGKRPALVDGIRAATSEFVALVDSDTSWGEHVKDYALVPFSNPRIGGVATRQSVLRPVTLAQRFFNAQLNLRYLEEVPFMMARGGTVLTCLSGRTAFYRRSAVLPLLDKLLHETFWGKPVISGDDKRLTYLIEGAGWQAAYQQNAHVFTPGMPMMKAFLKQRLRWTRNSWRADLRTLTEPWAWRHPRFVLYLIDRALQPFAQLLSPIFFIVSLALGLWIPAAVLFMWWHIGRIIRMSAYLRRAPKELRLVPVFVLFNFYSALMKVYALVTLNRQGWITRWDADRLPGAPPWLRATSSYVLTGLILGVLAAGVMLHEQRAVAQISWRSNVWPPNLVQVDQATLAALPEPTLRDVTPIDRYVVQRGDTLQALAKRWGTISVADILRVNAARLPSADYMKAGQVLDVPSIHHRLITAAYESPYKELGPLAITYVAQTNTIEVRGRGQQVGLPEIARHVDPQYLREGKTGEWYLGANIAIKAGVSLYLEAPTVTWLKLRSEPDAVITVTVESGQLYLRDTKVTSWDFAKERVDQNYSDGRSYIVAKGNGRFDIAGSELAYLGEAPRVDGPVGTSGVSWHVGNEARGQTFITGEVTRSRFHHNFDGLYVSGGVGLRLLENEMSDNARYGIDLYDFSHDCLIADNDVYDNGLHGIILSQASTNNDIRGNHVHSNRQHGIIIHQDSHENRVEGNIVFGQRDGIVLHHAERSVVTNNTVSDNERGIRLTASQGSLVADNDLQGNVKYGMYVDRDSGANVLRDNHVTHSRVGVYILGRETRVTANTLAENWYGVRLAEPAADNWVLNNQIEGNSRVGIYVSTLKRNFADQNGLINNTLNFL